MARICAITGRRPVKGSIINRKGQSKKSGGIGTHVTSITKRKFRPNLQRIRVRHVGLRGDEQRRRLGHAVDARREPGSRVRGRPDRRPVRAPRAGTSRQSSLP